MAVETFGMKAILTLFSCWHTIARILCIFGLVHINLIIFGRKRYKGQLRGLHKNISKTINFSVLAKKLRK